MKQYKYPTDVRTHCLSLQEICGFGFDKPGYYDQVYNSVADRLRKANNWIVFVRGNHDNPAYYAEERINHARWRTVPDYSIISVYEHNILCIGGATSIDRYQRIKENARNHVKDVSYYWPDEAPEYKPAELEAIPGTIRIDTVITHTPRRLRKTIPLKSIKTHRSL